MIRLALIDPDPQFAAEVERLLENRSDMAIVAVAPDLNRALIAAGQQEPHVMIIGPGVGAELAVQFTRKLTSSHPIGCLLFSPNVTANMKMAAIKANAVEVIQIPVDPEKIIGSIQTAAGYAQQLAIKDQTQTPDQGAVVITVFSTKGGVGKTVLSTNIAASIARQFESRVVVVDLDLQFGDVGIAMGLNPSATMLDFVENLGELDENRFEDLLIGHASGAKVILAPKEPESADLIDAQATGSIISALKRYADFIIIDTPASFNDNVLAVLDQSDEICVVVTMDMLSLKNIKLCLKTLDDLKYARERQKMVINRVETNVGLKVVEIEKVLGMRAIAKIPSDKAVSLSVNKGVPVVMDAPRIPVSREIEELALFYVNKYRPDWINVRLSG
ncbi:MAG: AAA family ATPase [Actinomycetota bacterium]|nr:AAA family ATPase [Actinomycetota bacterium]